MRTGAKIVGVIASVAVVGGGGAAAVLRWRAQAPSREVARGEGIFKERCAVCHATTDRGRQGPGLGGVVGRKAAGTRFGYSRALRASSASGLVWDASTLDRFLTSPTALVPDTTMPMSIADPGERHAVIAYLATLRPGGPDRNLAKQPPSPFGDFRTDAPGKRHRVRVEDLPPPFASDSANNAPGVVDPPAGARPLVPAGFTVTRYAEGLLEPRQIRVAPNGDVFIAESAPGRVKVLRDGHAEVFASGLHGPFGMAFFPPGNDPQWVYVAETNRVVRFAYRAGDLRSRGDSEVVVAQLAPTSGGHVTRDIVFSPDGARMYVSVGSASNVADGIGTRSADEARAWDAAHGVGAAWGDETNRADVLVFDAKGEGGHIFATGIRNCVTLTFAPSGDGPWCTTNERDGLGDDLVPDYVTRVHEGAFYGWPWYYLGAHEDPRRKGERPDLAAHVTVPDVLLAAHSAPLGMAFYDGAMFPAEYRGDAFVALHGSWNRGVRTGPKVVRVLLHDAANMGEYEEFVTGFTVDDGHVYGRPVGVAVAKDGALLVTDDASGIVWRVAAHAAGAD